MNQLVTKALQEGNAGILAKVPDQMLGSLEKGWFRWVRDYAAKHGTTPTLERFEKEFTSFMRVETPDPLSDVFEQTMVRRRNVHFVEMVTTHQKGLREGMDPAELVAELDTLFKKSSTAKSWKFETLDDVMGWPDKEWLVEGWFGKGDMVVVYGASGAAKTHAVLSLMFAGAKGGGDWGPFRVNKKFTTLYAMGEGWHGFKERVSMLADEFGVRDGVWFCAEVPQLYANHGEAMDQFMDDWEASGRPTPDVFIADTLHSATMGLEENSAKDFGIVLETVRRVIRRWGCAVLMPHHTNKSGMDERGSVALRGAVDLMVKLEKPNKELDHFTMVCSKTRHGNGWTKKHFGLKKDGEAAILSWDVEPPSGIKYVVTSAFKKDLVKVMGAANGEAGTMVQKSAKEWTAALATVDRKTTEKTCKGHLDELAESGDVVVGTETRRGKETNLYGLVMVVEEELQD